MKIGMNQICINPTRSLLPVGFITQNRNVSQVRGDLLARMVRIEDEERHWLCIAMDSFGISRSFFTKIEERIFALIGKVELTISCSHTHFAPSLVQALGIFEEDPIYMDFVIERIVHCLRNIKLNEIANPRIGYRSERFTHVGRNRITGKSDDDVIATVVSLFDGEKRLVNFLHYNCHPTISPEDAAYFSSDYVSIAIEQLTSKYPTEFTLFLQGAAGDVSTRFTRTQKTYNEAIRLGRMLGIKFLDLHDHIDVTEQFSLQLHTRNIDLHHSVKSLNQTDVSNLSEKEVREFSTAQTVLDVMRTKLNTLDTSARLTGVKIGPLRFCFLPFELVSGYLRYCNTFTLIVGYSQGYIGYVTLPENKETTYESMLETISEEDKLRIVAFLEDKA